MSNTQVAHKDELSFGVELEFLFYFQVPERLALVGDPGAAQNPDELTIDPAEEARLPPALTLPAKYRFNQEHEGPYDDRGDGDNPRGWANRLVKEAITSVPGARLEGKPMPDGTPRAFQSIGWSVKMDATAQDLEIKIQGYGWLNFEVTTPALWDRPESHSHVHQVIQELTKRFRLRVNVRTGFHCHVGAGLQTPEQRDEPTPAAPTNFYQPGHVVEVEGTPKKHSLGVFRRAAALMWAADGFLCHAHPPDRGFNVFAPPIRFFSKLAWGQKKRVFRNGRGEVISKLGELGDDAPFDAPVADDDELLPAQQALPSRQFPRIDAARRFPALRPREADGATRTRYETMSGLDLLQMKAKGELRNETVYDGVRHIMRCKNRVEIVELLDTGKGADGYGRANYNLANYLDTSWTALSTTTVECREASGTMSADWVVVWSNVCLGIFRFARDADDARFWAVIAQLAEAEATAESDGPEQQQKHKYDMLSLLFDMGLFAEGVFLERKLRADPMSFWFPNRLVEGKEVPPSPCWVVVTPSDAGAGEELPSGQSSAFVHSPVQSNSWEVGEGSRLEKFGDW